LLLVGRLEPLRVAREPRFERFDQRPLPLSDLLEAAAELPLGSIEVLVPGSKPLLDLALHLRERLRKAAPQTLLALAQRLSPVLRQPSLLFRIRRERVRSPAGQRALEVG
jgi:hypothetical protein